MDSLAGALLQMVVLLIIACFGFLAGKQKWIDEDGAAKLTKILLYITLPCLILASVGEIGPDTNPALVGETFLLSACQVFLLMGAGYLCNFLLRTPKDQRALYVFGSMCTNNGFIGLPVAGALLGSAAIIFASVYVMVLAVGIYSIGFTILALDEARRKVEAEGGGEKRSLGDIVRNIPWKSIVNPSIVASIVAIVMFLNGWQLPGLLQEVCSMTGAVTTPVAMMIVGAYVSRSSFKSVITEVRIYPYMIIRQLLIPLALFFVLTWIGFDPLSVGLFTIMFAMPVGSMVPAFSGQFGADTTLAAKLTIITTVGSFIIIPLLGTLFM